MCRSCAGWRLCSGAEALAEAEAGPLLEDEVAGRVERARDRAEDRGVGAQLALGDGRGQWGHLGQAAFEWRAEQVDVAPDPAAEQDELGVDDRGDGPHHERQPVGLRLDGGERG